MLAILTFFAIALGLMIWVVVHRNRSQSRALAAQALPTCECCHNSAEIERPVV